MEMSEEDRNEPAKIPCLPLRKLLITDEEWLDACLYLARKHLCQLRLVCCRLSALLAEDNPQQPCRQLHWISQLVIEGDRIGIYNPFAKRLKRAYLTFYRNEEWPAPVNYVRFIEVITSTKITMGGLEFLRKNAAAFSATEQLTISLSNWFDLSLEVWRQLFESFMTSRFLHFQCFPLDGLDDAATDELLRLIFTWLETSSTSPFTHDWHGNLEVIETDPQLQGKGMKFLHVHISPYQLRNDFTGKLLEAAKERFMRSSEKLIHDYMVEIPTFIKSAVLMPDETLIRLENSSLGEELLMGTCTEDITREYIFIRRKMPECGEES